MIRSPSAEVHAAARRRLDALAKPLGALGRLEDLAERRLVRLDDVRILVLDEADRMLDMGFEEPIRDIVGKTPKNRQTLLFSATLPASIREISQQFQRDPLDVTVHSDPDEALIEQIFFEVESTSKLAIRTGCWALTLDLLATP